MEKGNKAERRGECEEQDDRNTKPDEKYNKK
jgi:hypothetical protein